MEIHYTETNGYPETVVTVYKKDDLYKVADALELISELLCVKPDYDIDFDNKEVIVSVADYYEFNALRQKLYDHCPVA